MTDVDALNAQINKIDAKLAVANEDDATMARLHSLRESLKAEVAELEILVTGKEQLEQSMALLNKQKTSQFRTNMLMKWSRPAAGGGGAEAALPPAGGFTPRTLARKQAELKQVQGDKRLLIGELRDTDDQLEQIELEKTRLEQAADEDPDIAEALEELRSQLEESKRDKLAQMQAMEQTERSLATELGVTLHTAEDAPPPVSMEAAMGRGGGGGLDASSLQFIELMSTSWKRLESSSIEKVNVGQQEALGVKELIKLSNEAIENIVNEVKRNASQRLKGGKDDEILTLVYDLMIDASSSRKRLNDYTEGLLVQTAQKMDSFKAAFEASKRGGMGGDKGSTFTPRRK